MPVFSQTVDRVAPIAYFLGAVVPLVALGMFVERYTLGGVAWLLSDHSVSGIFSVMCLLSLGCFLMLRRAAHASVEQID